VAFKVGFIGLGIMGSRMAANLQAHGYTLTVFNRTRDKAETLLKSGATWGNTPAAVAKEADILFTMLATPEAVESAALGTDGFLRALRPGSIWVNSGTVNPSFARRMAGEARASRVRYLDAPVTGSKDAAAGAQLLFMVGGDAADLDVCQPLLSTMGARTIHVGGQGLGSALKMVNNLLGAVSMAAFAEGAALGQAFGVPRETMFDMLFGGPMVARVVAAKRARIERDDYDADFSMRWMQKDLHLASISAYEADVPMPVANVTKELYRLAMREGYADQDYGAIYAFLNGNPAHGPSRTAEPEPAALPHSSS
jgi:3-hydroxyisobutyrate dehydrogenase-like beta-hydroxyacid dehydrogenase